MLKWVSSNSSCFYSTLMLLCFQGSTVSREASDKEKVCFISLLWQLLLWGDQNKWPWLTTEGKPVRHFKEPCRNTGIFASVWHLVPACNYIQLPLDLLVVTVILIMGFNTESHHFGCLLKYFPWFFFRQKTSQLLKTMISLMKVTSYKSEMTTRSTSWRS